jgi:hypothetical protein
MLHRESLELRNQARILTTRVGRMKPDKLRNQIRAEDYVDYWPPRPQIG